MSTAAGRAEFDELMDQLAHLPADRRAAIARILFEVVGTCPVCGEAIRRCDVRREHAGGLAHLDCAPPSPAPTPAAPPEFEDYETGCACDRYVPIGDMYGNVRCLTCNRYRREAR